MTLAVLSVNLAECLARRHFAIPRFVLLVLVSFSLLFIGDAAFAQSSGKPRATKVAVAEVKTETIADFLNCRDVLWLARGVCDRSHNCKR